jgi:ABC-type spermidine/putrescine transport system permease subunit I
VVGGIIYLVIGIPIAYFMAGAQNLEEQLARSGVTIPFSGALLIILGGIIGALLLVVLAVAGGAIGVALFEKRKDIAPPPPPAM